MAPVRALFVPMNATIGGAERVLLDMLEGFDRQIITSFVALRGPGPLERAVQALDVRTATCGAPWWLPFDTEPHPGYCFRRYWESAPRFLQPLCDLITRERIDVVYSAGTPILHGALAAHVTRLGHLQHMQDLLGQPGIAYHLPLRSARVAYRLAGWLSSLTVCVGHAMRDDIGDAIPADKCRVVPLGFRRRETLVRPMALSPVTPGAVRVGLVGRVERLKGAEITPQIVQRVCASAPDTHFYWAGEGPASTLARLRDASVVGGEPHLHFIGYVDDISSFMAGIDVLLHPSRNDTFPRVLLEAALERRPVVVTRCGGGQEIVEDQVTGYVADVDDVEGLARGVIRLVHNRAQREHFGAEAARRAERFDLGSFRDGMQGAMLDAHRRGAAIRNALVARASTRVLYLPGRMGPTLRRWRPSRKARAAA